MSSVIRADSTVLEIPGQEEPITAAHEEISAVDDLTTWTQARVSMLAE